MSRSWDMCSVTEFIVCISKLFDLVLSAESNRYSPVVYITFLTYKSLLGQDSMQYHRGKYTWVRDIW